MQRNGYSKYKKNVSLSATRLSQQIVMVFDKLVSLSYLIEQHIKEQNYKEKCNALEQSLKIIYGLHSLMDLYIEKENQELIENFYRKAMLNYNFIKYSADDKSLVRCEIIKTEMKKMSEIWKNIDNFLVTGA